MPGAWYKLHCVNPSASQLLIARTSLHIQLWHKFLKLDLENSMQAALQLSPWGSPGSTARTKDRCLQWILKAEQLQDLLQVPNSTQGCDLLSKRGPICFNIQDKQMSSFILSPLVSKVRFWEMQLTQNEGKVHLKSCKPHISGKLWNHLELSPGSLHHFA